MFCASSYHFQSFISRFSGETAHLDNGFYNRYNGARSTQKKWGGTALQYREYDTEILNRIKDVEKQILCKYIEICEKYHLRYFVAFGTLLGTVQA